MVHALVHRRRTASSVVSIARMPKIRVWLKSFVAAVTPRVTGNLRLTRLTVRTLPSNLIV
jgi:hypothetical protein